MKNYNVYIKILFCFLLIVSCTKKQVKFYPSEREFNQGEKQIIDINKQNSTKEFYEE